MTAPDGTGRRLRHGTRPLPWLAALTVALAGCATAPPVSCAPPAEPKLVAELFLGRNIGARLGVSEAAFRRFVDREVTPRFPEGFTILDARGQYRDTPGAPITREPSKLLKITLSDSVEGRAKLAAIAEAYKRSFAQQSVLTVTRSACVAF